MVQNKGVYGLSRYEFVDLSLFKLVNNENDVYNNRTVVFPPIRQFELRPTDGFTGVIKVVPGSLLISLCGYSERAEGFTLSIFDKSANYYLFEQEFDWWRNQCGQVEGLPGTGQRFFTEPVVILGTGQLQLTVTNQDKLNVNRVQIALQFAERHHPLEVEG